jgi:hypothetical protein
MPAPDEWVDANKFHARPGLFQGADPGGAVLPGDVRDFQCIAHPRARPTLFTTAWRAGNFNGYEAGFVSTSSVKPGSFNPPTGTSPESGYSIAGGKVWFTYGGKRFGYIRESYWAGGFRAVTETQTYGEVYDNSPGGSPSPTMNGRVSNYRTNTGSRLTRYTLSSPYRITHAGGTGFTFSG